MSITRESQACFVIRCADGVIHIADDDGVVRGRHQGVYSLSLPPQGVKVGEPLTMKITVKRNAYVTKGVVESIIVVAKRTDFSKSAKRLLQGSSGMWIAEYA